MLCSIVPWIKTTYFKIRKWFQSQYFPVHLSAFKFKNYLLLRDETHCTANDSNLLIVYLFIPNYLKYRLSRWRWVAFQINCVRNTFLSSIAKPQPLNQLPNLTVFFKYLVCSVVLDYKSTSSNMNSEIDETCYIHFKVNKYISPSITKNFLQYTLWSFRPLKIIKYCL